MDYFCSDLGNHGRFIAAYGDILRHVEETGDWLGWDDATGWQKIRESDVYEIADQIAKTIYDEAREAKSGQRELTQHALKSQEKHKIKAMVDMTAERRPVNISVADVDEDPTSITVQNGVINLKTGTLTPHQKDHITLRRAPSIIYNPEAKPKLWLEFLDDVFVKDQELMGAALQN